MSGEETEETVAERLKILNRKRGSVKQRLTNFEKYVTDLAGASQQENFVIGEEVVIELEQRIAAVESAFFQFEESQDEIEMLAPDNELEVHYNYRQELESRYQSTTAKGRGLLRNFKLKIKFCDTSDTASSHASEHGSGHLGMGHVGGVKLPTIEVPTFHGRYDTWLEFRDTFESLINQHQGLSKIHKYHYLRASLKGEARQVIKSLDFSENNYETAWQLVCKRYDNKRLLINNHIKALFEFEKLTNESSSKLRGFADNIDKHLCALESLGQPTDKWDILIVHMASLKLDNESSRKWEEHQTGAEPPTLNDFRSFLSNRADFLESLELKNNIKGSNKPNESKFKKPLSRTLLTANQTCAFCQGEHSLYNCSEFQVLGVNDRVEKVKSLRLCLNCLRPGHYSGKCYSKSWCKHCKGKHNTLLHLHNSDKLGEAKPPEGSQIKKDTALWSHAARGTTSLLGTVCIIAFDKFRNPHRIRAVLDCGSQSSYITEKVLELLKLDSEPIELNVMGVGMTCSRVTKKCSIKVQSQHNAFQRTVSCLVIPEITGSLPESNFDSTSLQIPKHLRLADPQFNELQPIDMLIGADHFWELLCAGQIKLGNNKPILQKTRFGWIVSGPLGTDSSSSKQNTHCNFACELNSELERFWLIEEDLTAKRALSADEVACENNFQKTTVRDPNGRFIVSIPFKENLNLLGESKQRAEQLFHSLERRFQRDSLFRERYSDFMREYQDLGHMTMVNSEDEDKSEKAYYMPHHGVTREESETTKLRVVFNASSPSSSGHSLNDLQYVGPTIQEDLFSILLRFRQHTYVVSADITKMYRQVLIEDEQRSLQRILWREDPSLPVSIFNLNTITYGMSSAPFMAIRCLFQLANENQLKFPEASEIIRCDFYVDDLLTGADSVESLQQRCKEVSTILENGRFELRKWVSNNVEVLKSVDKSKWSNHSVNFLENDHAKTLGVGWSAKTDCLLYKIDIDISRKHVSKRSILSDIARIFDPLGLLAPIIMIAKTLLQDLWQLKISWDESIPLDLYTRWTSFRSELQDLNQLQIPRQVLHPRAIRIELHGFSDACERGYGACVYLRSFQDNDTITVRLLCAKGKVSPLKSLTIPRLELCGALILARLFAKVMNSLKVKFDSCTFWSDSMIVLGWLRTEPNRLNQFVSNRVAEIQATTQGHEWYHVISQDNPADLVSRGVNPSNLHDSKLWWSGPSWLSGGEPLESGSFDALDIQLPDMKQREKCLLGSDVEPTVEMMFNRFSDLSKLERVMAYCLRFVHQGRDRVVGSLLGSEVSSARLRLILLVQKNAFATEIADLNRKGRVHPKSRLAQLSPFLHVDGTIRVGGRLQNTNYAFDKVHPIVLPSNHAFTSLLFEKRHKELLHCGAQHLLASVRECYWPIGGRNLSRKIVRNCVTCTKNNPKSYTPMMGNLPEARVIPSPPFYRSGVDYAGPLLIASKKGRGCKLIKGYICIFVCLCTKGVHLEAVSDLSTEAFLMCMRRFVARRGKPIEVFSDNGTNFVGANNELKELGEMLIRDGDSLSEKINAEGFSWRFIPPRSPHLGGIWEAGVRSVKHHLKRVAGSAHLTFEELQTLLSQIESVLNSRPLYPMSPDPSDLSPLTPGHFIIGRPLTALPDLDLREKNENRLSHYHRVQQLLQHFWERWRKEYLSELQLRYKWKHPNFDIKIGALVVLKEENLAPLRWKMGRVCELHPGQDGHVRVVSVKTSTGGVVRRAVTRLCPLPVPDSD